MELNLSFALSGDDTILDIKAGGRLAIDNASNLLQLLREKGQAVTTTRLDLSGLEEIDLAGLQLICSACRTALDNSGKFKITGSYPAALEKVVSDSGLDSQQSCRQHPEIQCIFHQGAN